MPEMIYSQIYCLGIFVIIGIVLGILLDIFRILRRSFKTSDFITYLEDIVFWILTGFIVLFSIFKFNNGEIRIYVFLGIFIGIILHIITISHYFIKYSVLVIGFIKKVFLIPIRFITAFFNKIMIKPIHFFVINISKSLTKCNNKIKNPTMVKKKIKKKGIKI